MFSRGDYEPASPLEISTSLICQVFNEDLVSRTMYHLVISCILGKRIDTVSKTNFLNEYSREYQNSWGKFH